MQTWVCFERPRIERLSWGRSQVEDWALGPRPALNPEELNLREIPSIEMRTSMWR